MATEVDGGSYGVGLCAMQSVVLATAKFSVVVEFLVLE